MAGIEWHQQVQQYEDGRCDFVDINKTLLVGLQASFSFTITYVGAPMKYK
jgi:hypothetical protein